MVEVVGSIPIAPTIHRYLKIKRKNVRELLISMRLEIARKTGGGLPF
jgi:hypothetical protein